MNDEVLGKRQTSKGQRAGRVSIFFVYLLVGCAITACVGGNCSFGRELRPRRAPSTNTTKAGFDAHSNADRCEGILDIEPLTRHARITF